MEFTSLLIVDSTKKRKRIDGDATDDPVKRLLQLKNEERILFKQIGLKLDSKYSELSNILISDSLDYWIESKRRISTILQIPDIMRNIFEFLDVLTPTNPEEMTNSLKFGAVCLSWKNFINTHISSVFIPYHDIIGFELKDFLTNVNLTSIQTLYCHNPVVFFTFLAKLKEFGQKEKDFNPSRICLTTDVHYYWKRTEYETFSWKKVLVKDCKKFIISERFKKAIQVKSYTVDVEKTPIRFLHGFVNILWPEMKNVNYK